MRRFPGKKLVFPLLLILFFSLFFQCAPVKAATLDDINAIGKTNISAKDTATPPINPSLPKAEPGILEKSWAVVKGGIVGGTAGTVAGGAAGTVLGPAGIVVGSSVGRVIGTITGAKNALNALNQKTAAASGTGGSGGSGVSGTIGGTLSQWGSGGPVSSEFGQVTTLGDYITLLLRWILPIIGALAVLMLIYAGFILLTSAGNQESIKKAKELIIGVVAGIILLFSIQIILTQVVGNFNQSGATPSTSAGSQTNTNP